MFCEAANSSMTSYLEQVVDEAHRLFPVRRVLAHRHDDVDARDEEPVVGVVDGGVGEDRRLDVGIDRLDGLIAQMPWRSIATSPLAKAALPSSYVLPRYPSCM